MDEKLKELLGQPLGTAAARLAHYESCFMGYRDYILGQRNNTPSAGSREYKSYCLGAQLAQLDTEKEHV